MKHSYIIEPNDFVSAGDASGSIKTLLKKLGVNANIVRRVSIASYEAEMNLVIHSLGGVLTLCINPNEIHLTAEDKGPGISNIELAMQKGYSTASDKVRELGFGAGMGLPNIKRCADHFHIESVIGKGTKLQMRFTIL